MAHRRCQGQSRPAPILPSRRSGRGLPTADTVVAVHATARNRAALAGALRRGARDLDPTHGRPSAADGGAEGPTPLRTRRAQLCAATAAVVVTVATLSRARRSAPAGSG